MASVFKQLGQLEMTIHAMAASEDEIRAEMTAEGLD